MDAAHWTEVWQGRDPETVTWFQHEPTRSLRLIRSVGSASTSVIDVGGGASRLVDHLLTDGYTDLTVLDIAEPPLSAARRRLEGDAARVSWIVGDVMDVRFDRTFELWHDRAVFHFLVDAADRQRYVSTLTRSLATRGHFVVSTFGPEGPERCSGLPVRRYDADLLTDTLSDAFELVDDDVEDHISPTGVVQQFQYAVFRRTG